MKRPGTEQCVERAAAVDVQRCSEQALALAALAHRVARAEPVELVQLDCRRALEGLQQLRRRRLDLQREAHGTIAHE
jgi:hypothetical protein